MDLCLNVANKSYIGMRAHPVLSSILGIKNMLSGLNVLDEGDGFNNCEGILNAFVHFCAKQWVQILRLLL
jgi:hypothetical protein